MDKMTVPLQVGGTLMSAFGSLSQGKSAQRSHEFTAAQLDRNALAAEATSQREAIEERRKAELMKSRARAVAAAGGGTASDVGVMDIMAKMEREGEYNALTALFEGSEQAAGLRTGAMAERFTGAAKKKAGKIKAVSTLFSGAMKVAERYG